MHTRIVMLIFNERDNTRHLGIQFKLFGNRVRDTKYIKGIVDFTCDRSALSCDKLSCYKSLTDSTFAHSCH